MDIFLVYFEDFEIDFVVGLMWGVSEGEELSIILRCGLNFWKNGVIFNGKKIVAGGVGWGEY